MRTLLAIATLAAISEALRLKEITSLREKFAEYDVDGDGLIEASDASTLLDTLTGTDSSSLTPTSQSQRLGAIQRKKIDPADANGDGGIDFGEMLQYARMMGSGEEPDY